MTTPQRQDETVDVDPDVSSATMRTEKTVRHLSPPAVRFATPKTDERPRGRTFGRYRGTPGAAEALQGNNNSSIGGGFDDQSQASMINQSLASGVSFTPIMTPSRSGDVVLLSPSRTIAESLTSIATTTIQQLEQIWDEVGYTPDERANHLNDLLLGIHNLCEAEILRERGDADNFRNEISSMKEEIQQVSSALQVAVTENYGLEGEMGLEDDEVGPMTLGREFDKLQVTLSILRKKAAESREDLEECKEYIVEAHHALELDVDPKWLDTSSNLTQYTRQKFHEKKAEMKSELSTRTAAVVHLLRDCQHLMRDLKIEPESPEATNLDRRIAGSLVRSKDDSFMMASKMRSETCVGIGNTAMGELTKRVADLTGEKKRRKAKLQAMGGEISKLWEKLRVPEEDQRAFTESVRGLGLDTLRKGEAELQRLTAIKTEMIGQLIFEARQEIEQLWDEIDANQEFRAAFHALDITKEDEFDDQLLEAHEAYLSELRARLEERKPILRLIERRETILKERVEYENLQKDPDRLKQRSAALARQLLEEEKMARRIKRDLPKLTNILTEKLTEWRERHSEDFLYHGTVYVEEMARQEDEWAAYKDQKHQKLLQRKNEDQKHSDTSAFGAKKKTHHSRVARQPLGDSKVNLAKAAPSRSHRPAMTGRYA